MTETLIEKLTKTPEGRRLFQRERTELDMTELVCKVMDEQGVSRAKLAKRLSTQEWCIDKLLDGSIEFDLRQWSDVFFALGREVRFQAVEITCDAPATTTKMAFTDG